MVLVAVLILVLGAAVGLLILARSREQVVGAYVLFSLAVAVVTFGLLRSTGLIKRKTGQLGGAIAGFAVVLWMLLGTMKDQSHDVIGDLYIDGRPPEVATVCLLETDIRDNCQELQREAKGHFSFKDVTGVRDSVRIEVTLPGPFRSRVIVWPLQDGHTIRLELNLHDFEAKTDSAEGATSEALAACQSESPNTKVLYLFDLATSNLDPEKCNAFLTLLEFKLGHDIRAHLEDYQLLGDQSLVVERCPRVRVADDRDAIRAGRALGAPGVLWGWAEETGGQVRSVMLLTAVAGRPETLVSAIRQTNDLTELARGNEQIDPSYWVLASYLLALDHLSRGDKILAQRCLQHARDLGVPEGTVIAQEVERLLHELDDAGAASGISPIGQG